MATSIGFCAGRIEREGRLGAHVVLRLLLYATALVCVACTPSYHVEVYEPGFRGIRTFRMSGNVLASPSPGAPSLELNLERVDSLGHDARFFLLAEYSGSDGLRIRDGRSLLLIVDGDTLRPPTRGERQQRIEGGVLLRETRRYPIQPDRIGRMAEARQVEVVVSGATRTERRFFSSRNFENLRRFVEGYVAVTPPASDGWGRRGLPARQESAGGG